MSESSFSAVLVWLQQSAAVRAQTGQMLHLPTSQGSGKHTRMHTHIFLILFLWQAKAPAGETHSTLYSMRTCDCGGKSKEERAEEKRGRSEKATQAETLVFSSLQFPQDGDRQTYDPYSLSPSSPAS